MCIVLALLYRFVCARENKKRDKSGIAEAFENAYDDDMTDVKNKQFRHVWKLVHSYHFKVLTVCRYTL